jgi:uncharacterized protein YndB with AHSA1/START domain
VIAAVGGDALPVLGALPEAVRVAVIALLHGEFESDPNAFESVLTFTPDGAATRVEMRTVFPTRQQRDEAVETFHAIEGGQQTLGKLADYVTDRLRKGAEG